jgi:sortase (surface protein transpeptidase)
MKQRKFSRSELRKLRKKIRRIFTMLMLIAVVALICGLFFTCKNNGNHPKISVRVSEQLATTPTQSASTTSESTAPQTAPTFTPMTTEREDKDTSETVIGMVKVPKVGIDLAIVKGVGESSDGAFGDEEKLWNACTVKTDQVLGQNNYVLAAHAIHPTSEAAFTPLLLTKSGTSAFTDDNGNEQAVDVAQLALQNGDEMSVTQNSDGKTYNFAITNIFVDNGLDEDEFAPTSEALGDWSDKVQLTLYCCADWDGNARLVVQGDFVG